MSQPAVGSDDSLHLESTAWRLRFEMGGMGWDPLSGIRLAFLTASLVGSSLCFRAIMLILMYVEADVAGGASGTTTPG